MGLFNILLWIWVIAYFIDVLWYYYNPQFVKKYYRDNYDYFDFSFFVFILNIITFIIAPMLSIVIITNEIKKYLLFYIIKFTLRMKINKIKDKEIKNNLKKELKKFKV